MSWLKLGENQPKTFIHPRNNLLTFLDFQLNLNKYTTHKCIDILLVVVKRYLFATILPRSIVALVDFSYNNVQCHTLIVFFLKDTAIMYCNVEGGN